MNYDLNTLTRNHSVKFNSHLIAETLISGSTIDGITLINDEVVITDTIATDKFIIGGGNDAVIKYHNGRAYIASDKDTPITSTYWANYGECLPMGKYAKEQPFNDSVDAIVQGHGIFKGGRLTGEYEREHIYRCYCTDNVVVWKEIPTETNEVVIKMNATDETRNTIQN